MKKRSPFVRTLALGFIFVGATIGVMPIDAVGIASNTTNTLPERQKPVPTLAGATITPPTAKAPADITLPPSEGISVPDAPKEMNPASGQGELSSPDEHMPPSSLPRAMPESSSSTGNHSH